MSDDSREKDETGESGSELSRLDFLKTLGMGLGVAGIGSIIGGQAFAEGEKKGKYVVVVTHGADDPNRAILPLLMAQVAASKGWGKVHVWMTLQGADLAHRKKAEKIDSPIFKKYGTAAEIMKKINASGGTFGCCPHCAEYFGASGDDLYDFVDLAGADWLMKNIQDAWVAWM